MEKSKLEELENLFNKYGYKNLEKIDKEGGFLKIETYKVDLNLNQTIYREKLVKNGGNSNATLIIPLFDNGDILMVVQPRVFSSRGVLLDFPSGYIESEEDALVGAKRELEEETGYCPKNIEKLTSYYQDEGISDSMVTIYLATGIEKKGEIHLDKDEYLQTYIANINDLDEMVEKGYIKSGGGQLAISLLKSKMNIKKEHR